MTGQGAPVPLEDLIDPARLLAAWERHLQRTGLADNTKLSYARGAGRFVRWLLEHQDEHRLDEVFTDPLSRDHAVRHYKRVLQIDQGRKPKGVDTDIGAIKAMYVWTGLGSPVVPSAAPRDRGAPKSLDEVDRRRVMRAAEKRGPRDEALVTVGIGCGLRVSEIAMLNIDDVWMSARQGELQVRYGKGGKARSVPLNPQVRAALSKWLAVRDSMPNADRDPALFLSREGRRLAIRSVRYAVTEIGKEAGVDLAPHLLRHTFGTTLIRKGVDMEQARDLLGHSSVETTSIYARATAADKAAAVDLAVVDF